MDGSSALLRPSPPFPSPPSRSSNESPALYYIFAFLALIIIPTSIYLLFFLLKCPPILSRRFRRRSEAFPADLSGTSGGHGNTYEAGVSSVFKYLKETHAIDIGSECPVCLSAFGDGEEVRQLMSCKHSFHGPCIDLWLHSHSSCPICRVSVPLRASKV